MAWSLKKLLGTVGKAKTPAGDSDAAEPHLPGTPWHPPGGFGQLNLIDIDRTYRDKATKGDDGGWRTVSSKPAPGGTRPAPDAKPKQGPPKATG